MYIVQLFFYPSKYGEKNCHISCIISTKMLHGIGHSENKSMAQFSLFQDEIRPGVTTTLLSPEPVLYEISKMSDICSIFRENVHIF